MKPLSAKLVHLLLLAVRSTGSYNPDETLPCFEEHLTAPEYKLAEKFLIWICDSKQTFGHGNIQEKFAEFKAVKPALKRQGKIAKVS